MCFLKKLVLKKKKKKKKKTRDIEVKKMNCV